MGIDDILGLATFLGMVAAVILARRKANANLRSAFQMGHAQGMRDFQARVGASVVLGDVTYVRGDGNVASHDPTDHRSASIDGGAGDVGSGNVRRIREHLGAIGVVRDGDGDRAIGAGAGGVPVAAAAVPGGAGDDDVAAWDGTLSGDQSGRLDSPEALRVMRAVMSGRDGRHAPLRDPAYELAPADERGPFDG